MNKLNFTQENIAALPTPKDKRAVYHDSGARKSVPGLGVVVQPTSTRSFFWVKKVNFETVRLTIGKSGVYSVEQARAEATRQARGDNFSQDTPRATFP